MWIVEATEIREVFKVLLVEDSEPVRVVIEKQLRNEGIEVVSTATGEDALEVATHTEDLKVAILDRVLPGRIDGSSLVKSLKTVRPGIGVVQMTGYPASTFDHKENGPIDVDLTKPVLRAQLLDAVSYAYQAACISSSADA